MWQSSDRGNRSFAFRLIAPLPMEKAICDQHGDGLYRAGERVRPGRYRRIDGPGPDVVIEREDILPASFDGRVAEYERIDNTWDQIRRAPLRRTAA